MNLQKQRSVSALILNAVFLILKLGLDANSMKRQLIFFIFFFPSLVLNPDFLLFVLSSVYEN